MAANFRVCGYYRMSPLFSFLVLFPHCLPSMARFAFVPWQNALPKPLFSDSNHSLTALWMDRWRRSSAAASWKENGISPQSDVFYENGDAKQTPLHTDKIKAENLGGMRFQTLQRKKICTLKSKFLPSWAVSFFASHPVCAQSVLRSVPTHHTQSVPIHHTQLRMCSSITPRQLRVVPSPLPPCTPAPNPLLPPPGWLSPQAQPLQANQTGALLLIRGLVWRRRHPCSSPNFNHS